MACCDADGLFTMIETGYAGRNSDGGIFRASAMKHWITPLKYDENGSPFPYYFVADEAFPLSRYLMRPHAKQILDNLKRIFNYRLGRGRKTIECTFGMAAVKSSVLCFEWPYTLPRSRRGQWHLKSSLRPPQLCPETGRAWIQTKAFWRLWNKPLVTSMQ